MFKTNPLSQTSCSSLSSLSYTIITHTSNAGSDLVLSHPSSQESAFKQYSVYILELPFPNEIFASSFPQLFLNPKGFCPAEKYFPLTTEKNVNSRLQLLKETTHKSVKNIKHIFSFPQFPLKHPKLEIAVIYFLNRCYSDRRIPGLCYIRSKNNLQLH